MDAWEMGPWELGRSVPPAPWPGHTLLPPPAEHQDAFLRTDMSQAPILPAGAISITVGVNPSSGAG